MKRSRHALILELIDKYDIDTQDELAARLVEAGVNVTQATVSRDIRDLRLTKVAFDNGRQKYVAMNRESSNKQKYYLALKEGVISIDTAGNLVVLKTVPGMAMAVAAAIDEIKVENLVGCVAGDDTVFCAIKSVEYSYKAMEKISKFIWE